MEQVTIDDVDPVTFGSDTQCRRLAGPLGATDVAINHYRLAPGNGFPGGLHAHMDQEELFIVIEGEAVFETMGGNVTISAGEAIRFEPGEFQSGKNVSDNDLVAVAIGAPRDSEDVRIPLGCPDCGNTNLRLVTGEDRDPLVCPDCGVEHLPRGCPNCNHDLHVTCGKGDETVVVCPNCDTEFEEPLFQED